MLGLYFIPRVVRLSEDVTRTLYMATGRVEFNFLTKNGDYIYEARAARQLQDATPLAAGDWKTACAIADEVEAAFIVRHDNWRVYTIVRRPHGRNSYEPAVAVPHEVVDEFVNLVKEPDPKKEPGKRPSGAARRKARAARQSL